MGESRVWVNSRALWQGVVPQGLQFPKVVLN